MVKRFLEEKQQQRILVCLEHTFVMSPKADRFLVGALLGDSSACLLEFSFDFLRSEAMNLEFVVFPIPAMLSYKE